MFGERLKALRISKGITKDELAKIMGVSKQHITNLENNKSLPKTILLVKLALFFNTRANYLLGLDNIISKKQ